MLPVDATDLSWCSDGFDGYNDVGNEEGENEHGRPSGVSNHPKKKKEGRTPARQNGNNKRGHEGQLQTTVRPALALMTTPTSGTGKNGFLPECTPVIRQRSLASAALSHRG
jgi:hypothetical protein